MGKLTLLSLILFSVIAPISVSNSKQPRKTVRTLQYLTVGAVILWAYACMTYYPTVTAVD